MVKVTCTGAGGVESTEYDLDVSVLLEELMVLIEVDHGVPLAEQELCIHGKQWTAADAGLSLAEVNIKNDCRISVERAPPPHRVTPQVAPSATSEPTYVSSRDAADAARVLELFGASSSPPTRGQHPMIPSEDDAEVQRKLYETIQQHNIDESLANAIEFTPEAFGSVTMLYVECTVNQVAIKAFVDSGAQVSILNVAAAERCGLMRLLDKRMQGEAIGVGRQKVLGRIHMATVYLHGLYVPFSFVVLEEQSMEMIIGLDQLRRHQMVIDLKDNCLRVGPSTVIPFLPESELPEHAKHTNIRSAQDGSANAVSETADDVKPPTPITTEDLSGPVGEVDVLRSLMTLTGITQEAEAQELLAAAQGDLEAAVALYFE